MIVVFGFFFLLELLSLGGLPGSLERIVADIKLKD